MATTPDYGLPYPLGTDLIVDGDDVIRSLAERVEAVIRCGRTVITTDASGDARLTFPDAYPTSCLAVVASDATPVATFAGPLLVKVKAVDAAGADLRIFDAAGAAVPSRADLSVSWIALGT